jgi:hypothetical protein
MDDGKFLSGLFDACRTELEAAAERWRQETIATLDAAQAAADSLQFASRLFHAQRALDRAQPFLPRRLVQLLEFSMIERLAAAPARRRRAAPDEMALVDDDVVNESIEVSRIVGRIQLEAEWDIREAEDALSRQLGHTVNGERASPFHPEAFARAVWQLTEDMSLNPEERAACLRAGLASISAFARTTYACATGWCGRLDTSAGFVIKPSQAPATVHIPVDISLDTSGDPGLAALKPAGPSSFAQEPPVLEARDHVFQGVIANIERVLSDPRLTPELKRVLSGLQMATMRFALGSPEILYAPRHPIWSVVRTLADYALNHCVRDRLAHDDFVLFADDKIRTLLQLDEKSVWDLTPHLESFEQFARTRSDQLIDNEQTAIAHFARLEDSRRKILGVALNRHRERISEAIGATEMPFRLRQFLLADWAEVLARTELAEGPDSGAYAEYLQAARRVIERMRHGEPVGRGTASPQEVQPLLAVLERGMSSIALPSVEKHELASALLRPAARDWADSELHVPSIGDTKRAPPARAYWGVQGASSSSTAAANPTTVGMTSAVPAADAQQWVDTLRVGTVVELFLLGTWFEARVTSINDVGSLFTFEDEGAGQAHSLTRRALLRLVREGLASSP